MKFFATQNREEGRGGGGGTKDLIGIVSSLHRWPAVWVVSSGGTASSEPPAPGPCSDPMCSLSPPVGLGTGFLAFDVLEANVAKG